MASQIDVGNRALSEIGEARIIALTDASKQARAINSAFTLVRDAELRKHRWSFSIKRDQLAADATPPSYGYTNRFQLPTDCLRVLQVGEYYPAPSTSNLRNGPDQDFLIEGRFLLTDAAGPLPIRYVSTVEDTSQWDACFVLVMASALAAEVADELSASLPRKKSCQDDYLDRVRDAIRANAIELPPSSVPDDTWVTCRNQG